MSHNIGQLTKKYDFFQDISTIAVFIGFALIFMFAHRFEKTVIAQEKIVVEVKIKTISVAKPIEKVTIPESVKFPIAIDDDDLLEGDESGKLLFASIDDPTLISSVPLPPPPPSDMRIVAFFDVSEKPALLGGMDAIYKNLIYPKMAKRSGVEGSVTLKFVCSKQGIPLNISILQERPENMGFGEAAKKAFEKVRLSPGFQGDEAVAVRMTQRIKFILK